MSARKFFAIAAIAFMAQGIQAQIPAATPAAPPMTPTLDMRIGSLRGWGTSI